MIKSKELRGSILLLITAFVWGVAFVAQSAGAELVGPFTFLSLRSFLGGIVLLPLIAFRAVKAKRLAPQVEKHKGGYTLLIGGVLCGIVLGVASYFQQAGIEHTTVGNAGFITALYILIVPVLGLFFKKKVPLKIWLCIGIAIVALYLLTIKDGFTISKGDSLVMLCALVFSVHILLVDYFSPKVDGVKLACIQFFVEGLFAFIPMLLIEKPSLDAIMAAWMPIAYAGVLSSGVGYTLQIIGQKYTRPAVASLIMSLESVFAVLAGMVAGQIPSLKEGIGCVLMFTAIVLAQLPGKGKSMTKTRLAMLAAFGGNFIFGFSFLFTKKALEVTTPSVLLSLRFLLAFLVMNLLLLTGKVKVSFKGKPIGWLILMGFCQPVLYFYCENYGLLYSNATFSSVMIALVPIAALIFGALFMRERPTWLQVFCSAVSVGGVIWMALWQSVEGAITLWGVLLLVGAVVCAVGFNVISRRSAEKVTAFERTYMMFLVGTVVFGAVALIENISNPLHLVSPLANGSFVISLLYLGVLSSVGAFLMINYANTWLPLSRATVFSNVITVVSVFAGVVLLKDPFDIYMLIASVLIVLGIAGVQYFVPKSSSKN